MSRRIALVVAVLVIAGLCVWLARDRSSAGDGPLPVTATKPASTSPVAPEIAPAVENARIPMEDAPKVVSTSVSADPFALVMVLVVDKATNKPIDHAGVDASYERKDRPKRTKKPGSRGQPFEFLTAGADGRVEIEAPPGVTLQINASSPEINVGNAIAQLDALERGRTYDVTLALPAGFDMPFWLRVVDEDTLRPVAEAKVSTNADDPHESVGGKATAPAPKTTDASGLVLLDACTWRTRAFEITARHYGKAFVVPERDHATADRAYVVELRKGATLNVRVLDAARTPMPRVRVGLSCAPYELGRRDSSTSTALIVTGPHTTNWAGTTDANGLFTFEDLPARVSLEGEVQLKPVWPAPGPLLFAPGETRGVDWIVGLGHTIRGRVLATDGTPIPQCEVWLKKSDRARPHYFDQEGASVRKATTDDTGSFAFDNVRSDSWWVGPGRVTFDAQSAAAAPAPLAQIVELTDAMADITVDVRVDRGLFIRGVVLDAQDRPAPGARVNGNVFKTFVYFTGLTEADGSFTLGPLMADRYEVRAHRQSGEDSTEKLVARAGDGGLVLHLSESCTVAGQVIDETGARVACELHATNPGAERTFFMGTNVHNDGRFDLGGVNPGPVFLFAETGDGRFGFLAVPAIAPGGAARDLVVHVSPGGRVRIRHDGPDRYPSLTMFHGTNVVGHDNVERGTLREAVVPAGALTVELRFDDADRTLERKVEIKAGEVTDVVFEKVPR